MKLLQNWDTSTGRGGGIKIYQLHDIGALLTEWLRPDPNKTSSTLWAPLNPVSIQTQNKSSSTLWTPLNLVWRLS